MNKFLTKIATFSVGLAMAIGVGVAVGSGNNAQRASAAVTKQYTKVNAIGDLATNDIVVLSQMSNDAPSSGISSTSSVATSSTSSDWIEYKVTKSNSTFTLYNEASELYVTATGSNGGTFGHGASGSDLSLGAGASSTTGVLYNSSSRFLGKNGNNIKFYSTQNLSSYPNYYVWKVSTIEAKTVQSIAVTDNSGKTWYAGDTLNASDLQVVVTYSEGSATITDGTGVYFNSTHTQTSCSLSQGSNSITVYYTDEYGTADNSASPLSITAQAARTLSSISISGYTTTFDQGDAFEFGGTVTANYSNSTTENVTTSATFSGYDMSTSGSQTVTVSYTESGVTKTATYSITVNKVLSVTFTAGTDTGSTSVTKGGVTVSMSTMSRDDNYRCYSGTAITIESSNGNIDSIVFTFSSSSYNGGFNSSYLSVGSDSWTSGNADGQARITEIVVTLENSDPSVSLAPSSAESVTLLRGDSDTSVKVLVKNIETPAWTFTYDEGGNTGLSTSANISVSAGALDANDISTLTISTKQAGSTGTTTLHISVSDGNDDYDVETAIPVTVNQKPASMTVVHSDIVAGHLEIQTGKYKQVSWSGLDTDGNSYSISSDDVTPSATSGGSFVSLSGSRITGSAEGTAVVRYTLKSFTSVYAEVTVDVVDDYLVSVDPEDVTFATGLTAKQGDSPTIAVFTAHPGTTHFGESEDIPLSYFRFSYNDELGVAADQFGYDFNHGTSVDSTHKSQEIFVYCTLGNVKVGSYVVTVEQLDDPLTAIALTNAEISDKKVNITRGGSLQLTWSLTPTNPTDGKEVLFVVSNSSTGSEISVNSTGLISAGTRPGATARVTIKSSHDASINDYVDVTVAMESMTYQINEPISTTASATVSVGDRVVMVAVDKNSVNYEMTAFSGASTDYGVATSYTTSSSNTMIFDVVDGNSEGTVAFKTSDNKYVAWVSGKNSITNKSTLDDYGSWTINGTTFQNKQDTTRYMYLNYNSGTPRFACYTDKSSDTSGNYTVPTFLKVTGGNSSKTIDSVLFNVIADNFGSNKTYEWSESCEVFNSSAWESAGSNLTGIANFSSYKLNRAVANANGNAIEQFLAKYDFIISKSVLHATDFLHRFDNGGIMAGAKVVGPTSALPTNSGNTATIIIVISLVSVTAIGGYFFMRKRKEIK